MIKILKLGIKGNYCNKIKILLKNPEPASYSIVRLKAFALK